MSENSASSKLGFFLAGAGIGAILALLFAPKSGKETRDYLADRAEEGRDYLRAKTKDIRRQAEDYVERGKDLVSKQKEQLSAALEAGKHAYQEIKGKAH